MEQPTALNLHCTGCGRKRDGTEAFCPDCGKQLTPMAEPPVAGAAAPMVPAAIAPTPPPPARTRPFRALTRVFVLVVVLAGVAYLAAPKSHAPNDPSVPIETTQPHVAPWWPSGFTPTTSNPDVAFQW